MLYVILYVIHDSVNQNFLDLTHQPYLSREHLIGCHVTIQVSRDMNIKTAKIPKYRTVYSFSVFPLDMHYLPTEAYALIEE